MVIGPARNRVSASLVLYHNPESEVTEAVRSFVASPEAGDIVVVDNSATPLGYPIFRDPRVQYVFTGQNLGFGAGHNLALASSNADLSYHLLLNPDVSFTPEVLTCLADEMDADSSIGAAMPRITFTDGRLQPLAKLLPNPFQLFARRFIPFTALRARLDRTYELRELPLDRISDVPSLSACFLLARATLLRRVGGFDPRYFMYMEDVDLVRRLGDHARTVYVPQVSVCHNYGRGSYRDRRLLTHHLRSARLYFNRWGWVFDPERRQRNRALSVRLTVKR